MTQTMSMKLESKKNCESIHSGQFMVSHFETELDEYPAEDEEDIAEAASAVPSTSTGNNASLQLERYKPEKRISDVYEIDSDLSQVFNTLNVTYKWVKVTQIMGSKVLNYRTRSRQTLLYLSQHNLSVSSLLFALIER